MCTIPPPLPPPPPPPVSETVKSPTKDTSCSVNRLLADNPESCVWASSNPELRRACILARICLDDPPFKYKDKLFDTIIQVGPTCGIVALSMLINGDVSPEEILSIARLEGYTNNGEMFSCKNMVQLARKVISLADEDNISFRIEKELYRKEIVDYLLDGAILLVAYDADVNHAPTTRKGHTAHWGLVCGVVIDKPTDSLDNVYVLCRHGKSMYVSAWSLAQLAKSNDNLEEFSPKKQNDGLVYIMPEGGMAGEDGLKGQFIVVTWK